MRRRHRVPARLGLAQQLLLLQVLVVTLTVAVGAGVALVSVQHLVTSAAGDRVLAVAETVAADPDVAAGLTSPDPAAALAPLAERVRAETQTSFVVVMAPDRTRYSHPDPAQVGGRFLGTIEPALAGRSLVEEYTGTLGPSVRSVVPVYDDGGALVGLVAVGVTTDRVGAAFARNLPLLAGATSLALAMAIAGSLLIARRVRRQTLGMAPQEITRLYLHHDAVLHAVREGLLVVDAQRRLVLANDEAARLLDLPAGAEGRPVTELALSGSLTRLLTGGTRARDEVHLAGERLLVVNQVPAGADRRDGRDLGTVTTLRDSSELKLLTDELSAVRSLADSLRAQAHESDNRLHTIIIMIEMGHVEDALRFATAQVRASQELTDRLVARVEDPALVALLLGKAADAHERSVELTVTEETALHTRSVATEDLLTVVGNLVDNAIDATLGQPPPRRVEVTVREQPGTLVVRVRDNGPGVPPQARERVFDPGWSTKSPAGRLAGRGIGLALVRRVATRLGGTAEVGFDGGAVFTVRLPIPRAPREPAPGGDAVVAPVGSPRR